MLQVMLQGVVRSNLFGELLKTSLGSCYLSSVVAPVEVNGRITSRKVAVISANS